MKLTAILLLILVISGSMASKSTYQPKLTPSLTLKDKLGKSNLGTAVLNMVQMGNTLDLDFEELFNALNLLKESLEERKQAEIDDFAADEGVHKANVARITALVNSYEAAAIQYQDELTALQEEAVGLNSNLSNLQGQLQTAESQRDSEQSAIERLANDFQQQSEDYQAALDLLAQAVEKLEEALNSSNSIEQPVELIQMSTESMTALGADLQKQLSKVNTDVSITRPIQQFFVQLSSGNPEPSAISRAIQALNNLRDFYQEGLVQLEADFNTNTDNHQALLNTILVQIGNLSNVQIPQVQQEVASNEEAQEIRDRLFTEAERDGRIEQGNLDAENESWEARVEINNTLLPQYDAEYAVVEQAEQLLQQQQ